MEKESVAVPDEVITFIAQEIKANIRELEGALIRVVAYSLLEENPISLDTARVISKDMVKESFKMINVDKIQLAVANYFNVSSADFKTKKRNRNIVLPRQIAMYLSRHLTNLSLPEIGASFGGKDHTTVLHSYKKIEQDLQKNEQLKDTINKLTLDIQR